jgi:hypothetical protein
MTTHGTQTHDFKTQARHLRDGLGADGVSLTHGKALELVAKMHGHRDWNTLSAASQAMKPEVPVFQLGQNVDALVHGKPGKGRIIGLEETINPDVLRLTVLFNPAVDMSTSEHFSAKRTRVTMEFGRDGRSKRLNGADTGVIALKVA